MVQKEHVREKGKFPGSVLVRKIRKALREKRRSFRDRHQKTAGKIKKTKRHGFKIQTFDEAEFDEKATMPTHAD